MTPCANADRDLPRPAIFFDRDGVLNVDHGYVAHIEHFQWIDGAVDAILTLNRRGWLVFVVTNQSGIGRGLYTEADYLSLKDAITSQLGTRGAHIDDWRYCPDHPDATIPRYRRASDWRKPEPGMLLDLMRVWPVDRERSLMIGDKPSDLEAATRAGLAAVRFSGGSLLPLVEAHIAAMECAPVNTQP